MITYHHLKQHPHVFLRMTGLRVPEFDALLLELLPTVRTLREARLDRANRQRGLGGGLKPQLAGREQVLLTVIWLRLYPTHDVLGYLFGISQPTVGRYLRQIVPLLNAHGQDHMRMPDPGRKRRVQLPDLLAAIPELAVVVDTFEQPVQRPRRAADRQGWFSGKRKTHTLKSQVSVAADTGRVVHLARPAPGPSSDLTMLRTSSLLDHLPPGCALLGDTAYQGIAHDYPLGFSPIKRLGRVPPPLSPQQVAYNHAFSSRRIVVEMTLSRFRAFQSLTQRTRHHRDLLWHALCLGAVAALVNWQFASRFPA